ncbi:hypothetical protein D3C76_1584580 [compost metagenome]
MISAQDRKTFGCLIDHRIVIAEVHHIVVGTEIPLQYWTNHYTQGNTEACRLRRVWLFLARRVHLHDSVQSIHLKYYRGNEVESAIVVRDTQHFVSLNRCGIPG